MNAQESPARELVSGCGKRGFAGRRCGAHAHWANWVSEVQTGWDVKLHTTELQMCACLPVNWLTYCNKAVYDGAPCSDVPRACVAIAARKWTRPQPINRSL